MEAQDSQSGKETNADTETSSSIPTKYAEYSNISSSFSRHTETSSQPISKIFVEDHRGFTAIESSGETSTSNVTAGKGTTPSEIALKVNTCFYTFSHFCHGLLAGISLWQCVLVYQLSTTSNFKLTDFIEHYGLMAQPFHTLLFFLCAISIVSVFDRFDVANLSLSSAKYLFCSVKIIVLLLYPLCLLFSISLRNVDDLFSLYQNGEFSHNSTHFEVLSEEFNYWRNMNTARCIFAILGWFFVIIIASENVTSGKQSPSKTS